ncbi:MAG TPA: TetR/AcrR family transcriptional regulator [Terriglobales bacterium]|nr:TetR/AcrR family transcriptional regulator [Terriglobales bacterium]
MTTSLNSRIDTGSASGPAPMGRRERKRTQTRERIFRSAMQLFAERGFLATTVEDITEAADVGKGTFFNYFPTKEHVLSVLYEIQLGKVAEARAAAESGKQPIRQVLHDFMLRIAEEPGRTQQLARGLFVTTISSESLRKMMFEMLARGRQVLANVLQRGQERGEIRRDLRADDLARVFQQNVMGTILFWSLNPPARLQEHLDRTFEIFWLGISSPAEHFPGERL